jgi:hypothetical protein
MIDDTYEDRADGCLPAAIFFVVGIVVGILVGFFAAVAVSPEVWVR